MRHLSTAAAYAADALELSAAALLGLALCAAPCGAAEVKVSYDTQADFSQYKTWSWRKGTPWPNLVAEKQLREGIEAKLEAAGLQRKDSGGDLQVTHHAAADHRIGVKALGYEQPDFEIESTRVSYVVVGTVLVDMIDAGTGKVVWRGRAQGVANPAPRDVERRISEAIAQLFEHFPPAR
jgi:hypothetical protein